MMSGSPAHLSRSTRTAQGQASDVLIQAQEMQRMKDMLVKLYVDHCGQEVDEVGAHARARVGDAAATRERERNCVEASGFRTRIDEEAARSRRGCMNRGSAAMASDALPPSLPTRAMLPCAFAVKTLDRDSFMSAEQARDWGVIDAVVARRAEAEVIDVAHSVAQD